MTSNNWGTPAVADTCSAWQDIGGLFDDEGDEEGGWERYGELTCTLAEGHDGPHLDISGYVQWLPTPAGLQRNQEVAERIARQNSPEAVEEARVYHEGYLVRRAEEEERAASEYSQGVQRIREWLVAGDGQLVWREQEFLSSVNGGGVILKGTAAHVWLGNETLCGAGMPIAGVLHSEMPGAPIKVCRTCAGAARRRRLPTVSIG